MKIRGLQTDEKCKKSVKIPLRSHNQPDGNLFSTIFCKPPSKANIYTYINSRELKVNLQDKKTVNTLHEIISNR